MQMLILYKMHVLKQLFNLSNEELESKANNRCTFFLQHTSLSPALNIYIIVTILITPGNFHSQATFVNN
jgi:hypothetical protein